MKLERTVLVAGVLTLVASGAHPVSAQEPYASEVGWELAVADFNGDGVTDLAVGAPGQTVNGSQGAGAIHVHYGSQTGVGLAQIWSEHSAGLISPAPRSLQGFGTSFRAGDFDGDGYADLVVGVDESIRVIYGSSIGLSPSRNQRFDKDSASVEGTKRSGEGFGSTLAIGDFNGDARDDVAIAAPGKSGNGAGTVNVIYGSPAGLSATHLADQIFTQTSLGIGWTAEEADDFGATLAVGDFDGNGIDDLAIGAPTESLETPSAVASVGSTAILYGAATRLAAGRATQGILPATLSVVAADVPNANLGRSLAAGDFNGDGVSDLAMGGKTAGGTLGALYVAFGQSNGALRTNGYQIVRSTQLSLPQPVWNEERFGERLSVGNFNGDAMDDLVVGVFHSGTTRTLRSAGYIDVLFGAVNGVGTAASRRQLWSLDSTGVDPYTAQPSDMFGWSSVAGDFNADGLTDLAVSAPYTTSNTGYGKGVVTILLGRSNAPSAPSLTGAGSQTFHLRMCTYWAQTDDCMDRDRDGILAGVERLAGTNDALSDSDADGIPDGVEILPEPSGNPYQAQTRSNPVKPTLYTLLLHPSDVTGLNATTLKSELNKHFAGSSALQVITWNKPLSGTSATTLASSCIQTIASETNAPNAQQGWLTPAQLTNYVGTASTDEISIIAPYARVGRICSAGDSSPTVKGMVQYKGGWQFMVQMRSLAASPSADFVARWHRALGSLAAHELGHALGLGHGGGSDDDCSPLYPSVMNHGYDFQPDASGRCSQIGFSSGVLSAHAPAKQLEIVAGNGSTTGTSEYDVLQGAVTNTGAPVNAAHLGFLACFGKGDLGGANDSDPLQTVALKPCPDAGSATYCANWDRDEFEGAEESLDVASEYVSVDRRYDASSLLQTRTLGGRGAGFVSGCAVSDLNPDARNPPPAPLLPLQDHDDFALILELLRTTAAHAGCGIDSCTTPVTEPNSATLLDTLRGLWP